MIRLGTSESVMSDLSASLPRRRRIDVETKNHTVPLNTKTGNNRRRTPAARNGASSKSPPEPFEKTDSNTANGIANDETADTKATPIARMRHRYGMLVAGDSWRL